MRRNTSLIVLGALILPLAVSCGDGGPSTMSALATGGPAVTAGKLGGALPEPARIPGSFTPTTVQHGDPVRTQPSGCGSSGKQPGQVAEVERGYTHGSAFLDLSLVSYPNVDLAAHRMQAARETLKTCGSYTESLPPARTFKVSRKPIGFPTVGDESLASRTVVTPANAAAASTTDAAFFRVDRCLANVAYFQQPRPDDALIRTVAHDLVPRLHTICH